MRHKVKFGPIWITVERRVLALYGPVTFYRAEPDGHAVLRGEKWSWRKVNGILFNTRWGFLEIIFRRHG